MSQPAITSFFNSRKRAATDDIYSAKAKVQILDQERRSVEKSFNTIDKNSLQTTPKTGKTHNHVKLLSNKKESLLTSVINVGDAKAQFKGKSKAVTKLSFDGATSEQTAIKDSSTEPLHKGTIGKAPVFSKKTNSNNISNNAKRAETISLARQQLSLGVIKQRLANCSKLAQLRESADKLTDGFKKLKELEARRTLKEFKSINVDVPVSPSKKARLQNELLSPRKNAESASSEKLLMSPRKVVVSPVKSPSKVPAYIRHASLATASTSLPLPHHYRFLGELFRALDTVSSLLFNRNEQITFTKLKPSIQEMLKRNFTEKHLEQIKCLVPDFYRFEIQKAKAFSASNKKETYELLVSPNLPADLKIMSPTVLLDRRRVFYERLLQQVKQHHSNFLITLDPPMVIPDEKLARWHPEFELEKIPEIESSKLPEMPNKETYSTAQDVLAKARDLFKCNTKMERALEKLAQAKARGLTQKEQVATGLDIKGNTETKSVGTQSVSVPTTSGVTLLNPALRNLPPALLEKIKAKQAAKALEAMTRTSEDEKKYLIYNRLPDLARTLRNIFVTERKNVLALSIVLSKLDSSFKANVSATDLHGDIKTLSQALPDWVSLPEIRNTPYVKLDRAASLEQIKGKLEALADKYKGE